MWKLIPKSTLLSCNSMDNNAHNLTGTNNFIVLKVNKMSPITLNIDSSRNSRHKCGLPQ